MRLLKIGVIKWNLFLLFTIIGCTTESKFEGKLEESEKLNELFKKEWEFRLKDNPLFATSIGENQFNDLLPHASKNSQNQRLSFWKESKKELLELDTTLLSTEDILNYKVFEFYLDNKISEIEHEAYLTPIKAEGGFYLDLAFAINSTPFKTIKDYENYISRLNLLGNFFDENIDLMKLGKEKGKTLPSVLLASYDQNLNPLIKEIADSSSYFKPFLNIPQNFDKSEKERLATLGRKAINEVVMPSILRFKHFLQNEYSAKGRKEVGISSQPNGVEYYKNRVAHFTTLDLSPDSVFAVGVEEVSRIKKEMRMILDSLDYSGDLESFFNFLRTDSRFYPKTEEELLRYACYVAKKIDGKLPQIFKELPTLPYGVEPVPSEIAPRYTTGRYIGGSWDSRKAGFYWVNTSKLESRPLYVIPALTLHEAVPGHHLQVSLARELKGLPNFRRDMYISAFGEGWALYGEWLGKELGIYEDLYQDFGRLTYEMWRACRLVVDVGLHFKGWTKEKAVDFMKDNTSLSHHEINTEIDRYIGWPGQALSYKIGELKIKELRVRAEKYLGDQFDLGDFHRVVLGNGCIPLNVLEDEVNKYIYSRKASS